MLRATPPGEDATNGSRALAVSINAPGTPPGEDGLLRSFSSATGEIENMAQQASEPNGADPLKQPNNIDFLQLVREAEDQALLYIQQANRRAWSQSLRAFHNEHYVGSKYTRPDWRGRSKLFVPKTRNAVHKDMASVAASLFNSIDAINCLPGNEGDPVQRAAAAVMQELVNYRTDRTSGKASFPWFLIAMGARQDATLTGVCCSKQYWKQEYRKVREEKVLVQDENRVYVEKTRDVYALECDRPDMALIPPENYVIDPAACWTDPVQKSAFYVVKWPMQIEEIRAKQDAPVNPWKPISEEVLKNSVESGKFDMAAIRRARELGIDRLDETQTGTHFQVIWVYEVFLRVDGEDWQFWSVGDQEYLTDPKPVREVYPEQFGARPYALGYGSLEAHRIYPMAPVEAWQPLQLEINDLRNLRLDATKQNVMPISKVRRGRQIDLDQVKRRSSGSSILVSDPTDVTWEQPPAIPPTVVEMSRELDLELDDVAGQQNYGSVQTNNALGKTLGGLKLAAGAANSVAEFDIRLWIETWAQVALSQVVRLEQYYEADPVVLGLAGQKAQLFKKYGINKIDDNLLEQDVTIRVSVGLGAGDPQQRLAKFEMASQIVTPIIQQSPEFLSGKREINIEAIIEEVFGAAGYKDAGRRFFKDNGQPAPNPHADLQTREIEARIAKDERTGQAAFFTGLSALAKVALGKRELEAEVVDRLLGRQIDAKRMGFEHGAKHNEQHLAAMDHGHRHGLAIAQHHRDGLRDARDFAADQAAQQAPAGGGAEMGAPSVGSPPPAASGAGPPGQPSASPPPAPMQGAPPGMQGGPPPMQPGGAAPGTNDALMHLLVNGKLNFTRGPDGRISGVALDQQQGGGEPHYEKPQDNPAIQGREAVNAGQPIERPPASPIDDLVSRLEGIVKDHATGLGDRLGKLESMAKDQTSANDDRIAKLEAATAQLGKPRKIIRDQNNRIVGLE
jgi:hypothetical protein